MRCARVLRVTWWWGRLGWLGPRTAVAALEAALEDVEHDVEVVGLARAIDDGERAEAEGLLHVAGVVAAVAAALDGHNGGWLFEAGEEFEEARAALVEVGGEVEGEI